jgi:hypothetical protein
MIDKPENGHNPELRDKEGAPMRGSQTTTVTVEPDASATKPAASNPDKYPKTLTPTTEPAPTPQAAEDQSGAAGEPPSAPIESEATFTSDLTKFRQSFEGIQAEFIGEPRAAVEKAEALIDGLMNTLHDELQRIHSDVKTDADTERLRVAMLSYRELFGSLGGRRTA